MTEGYVGVSEFLLVPMPAYGLAWTRKWFKEYLETAEAHKYQPTEAERAMTRGKLTLLNKFFLLPAAFTSCRCCLGMRIYAALVIGLLLGKIL